MMYPLEKKFFKKIESQSRASLHSLLYVDNYVWGGDIEGRINIWSVKSAKFIGSRQAHKARIFSMLLVGNQIWSASDDGFIKVWSKNAIKTKVFQFKVSSMVFTGVDMWLGGLDRNVVAIVNVNTLQITHELDLSSLKSNLSAASQDKFIVRYLFYDKLSDYIWVCSDSTIVRVNRKTLDVIDQIPGSRINSIVAVDVSSTIWACSSDSTISIYDRSTGALLKRLEDHERNVFSLLSCGNYVWSAGHDKVIRIWDGQKFTLVGKTDKHEVIYSIIIVPYRLWINTDQIPIIPEDIKQTIPQRPLMHKPIFLGTFLKPPYTTAIPQTALPVATSDPVAVPKIPRTHSKSHPSTAWLESSKEKSLHEKVCTEIYTLWAGAGDGSIFILI